MDGRFPVYPRQRLGRGFTPSVLPISIDFPFPYRSAHVAKYFRLPPARSREVERKAPLSASTVLPLLAGFLETAQFVVLKLKKGNVG
jgi:hypothetical protein